jgi:hypothetical protein
VLPRPSFPARRFFFCSQFLLSPSSGACSMLTLRPHAARFCFSLLLPGSVGSFWFLGPCRSDLSARLRFPGRRSCLDFPRLQFGSVLRFGFSRLQPERAGRFLSPFSVLGATRTRLILLLVSVCHEVLLPCSWFASTIGWSSHWISRSGAATSVHRFHQRRCGSLGLASYLTAPYN